MENQLPECLSLDDLDYSIIELMKVNGRITYREVGDRLHIPEATARYRVQRLLNNELLQIKAWVNPNRLRFPHATIMNLMVENGQLHQVANQLAKFSAVQFLSIVSGQHNLVMNVSYDTYEDLLRFFDQFSAIRGIVYYETQVITRLVKAHYDYDLS